MSDPKTADRNRTNLPKFAKAHAARAGRPDSYQTTPSRDAHRPEPSTCIPPLASPCRRNEARNRTPCRTLGARRRAISDHCIGGGADDGEGQIARGLGERGVELLEAVLGFLLLRLQDVDIRLRRVDRCLAALDRCKRLVAVGLRLFERLLARIILRRQRLLAIELEPRPLCGSFG